MTSTDFSADYFDGRTSRRRSVIVSVASGFVAIRGEGVFVDLPREQASVLPRLGRTPVRIGLPGGGLLVANDFDAVEASLGVPRAKTLAYRLESHFLFVILALAAIVIGAWFAYRDGIPWASGKIAARIPAGIEAELSAQALGSFDKFLFRPSAITPQRREALGVAFSQLVAKADVPPGVRLEFRNGGFVGPNALTLPGGVIVVTDQLARMMDDRRLTAILAHELGHVHHRHGTRHLLNNSLHAFFAMAVFGDVSAVASLAAIVPTVFLDTGYSRDFEREADAYAVDLLPRAGMVVQDFVLALDTLRGLVLRERDSARGGARDFGYLSTHPNIEERLENAENAMRAGWAAQSLRRDR